jgi:hypothetical protein
MRKIAIYFIHGVASTNPYPQMGHSLLDASTFMAQEGHSFFFICKLDYLKAIRVWIIIGIDRDCIVPVNFGPAFNRRNNRWLAM